MDKYEVIGPLGEGSFGRVYKAKQLSNSEVVALKVIGKRGRSAKEIKGLRRECEIQRHLDHPNIIKMLDSFETENEIVVITEFAQKELNAVLGKEGYLSEERVQTIVWDLVSALYYLHSHRVLHRDLKPQNILLDLQGKSKLCDFGFARNMSTGTHVLTSIKGTPLYMAPELIEEHPYDHTADLWSLGCITYELLVGAPPFCTTSILHLIRMIRLDEVQFPTFISDSCISFLKGLLQKDPGKRLTWPEILRHTFIKGHVFVLNDTPSKPLTRLLSMETLHAKERQRKSLTHKVHSKLPTYKNNKVLVGKPRSISKKSFQSKNENGHLEEQVECLSLEDGEAAGCDLSNNASACATEFQSLVVEADPESSLEINDSPILLKVEDNLNLHEDSTPIENEEWVVFLQRSIEEVLAGELTSVCQASLANISVTPLRKLNASPIVISYVAKLFSLPFVIESVSDDTLEEIKQVYIDIKLIANLVYASKLLSRHKPNDSDVTTSNSWVAEVGNLSSDDLAALESVYLLICHLVHLDVQFLSQFCDSVAVLGMDEIFRSLLLLSKIKLRIVTDLIAILTHVLQKFPENYELVKGIICNENEESVNFVHLLKHSSCLLRERTCYFLQFLGRSSSGILESMWNDSVRDTLEALVYDSIETVRIAAESSVDELKILPFYNSINNSNDFITT